MADGRGRPKKVGNDKANKRNKPYHAQYWDKENKKRKSLGWYKTYAEVKDAQANYKKELSNIQLDNNKKDLRFIELCNEYADYLKANCTTRSYNSFKYEVKGYIKQGWADLNVKDITPVMINSFIEKRKIKVPMSGGYKTRMAGGVSTAHASLRTLRAIFRCGIRLQISDHDPTTGVKRFSADVKKRYIPPTEHIDKIIAACEDQETADYLQILKYTAARPIEINNAKFSDVDWESREITLWTRKKRNGILTPRAVPMNGKVEEIITRRKETKNSQNKLGYIFWYHKLLKDKIYDGPYQLRKNTMKSLCNKAEVPYFTLYALRHWAATQLSRMVGEDFSIADLMEILGHREISTTAHYLHGSTEKKRVAIDRLEAT